MKTCGNCARCEKYIVNGKETWSCEEAYGQVGIPVRCDPPWDNACKNWTDDPKEKGKIDDSLRYFVDHFWDDCDD